MEKVIQLRIGIKKFKMNFDAMRSANTTIILLIAFTQLSCDKGEDEIVIVPKDYNGYAIVIFDQKDGALEKYQDKNRVYEIPESGILKTRFKGNYGRRGFAEFYHEKISAESKLPSFAELKKIPRDSVVRFIGANGTVKKDPNSDERIEFVEFYVGTREEIEQAQKQVERLGIMKLME
jgi:hypothetical protein